MQKERGFIILDFGSQLTQLIARRLRELGFYSEIHRYDLPTEEVRKLNPLGIVLSGGPSSVYDKNSPQINVKELLEIGPLLGICYGMQLMAEQLGGKVEASAHREYGFRQVRWQESLENIPSVQKVWMSHGDVVTQVPEGFSLMAVSDSGHVAAMRGPRALALQFHPEVVHTEQGTELIEYFAKNICHSAPRWLAPHIIDYLGEKVKEQVGSDDHVLVALSGGVDSSVVATLLTRVLGAERVHCVFVDNGLLRKNEYSTVLEQYKKLGLNLKGVNAQKEFLTALRGVSDPESKRKIIGRVFIEIFEKHMSEKIKWLAQGTLYPDVIESFSATGGPSQTIKSHHNVGGLPEKMKLKLVEPLRELFKDEVRRIGDKLGLDSHFLERHPFPGPGLAIRILGEVNEEDLHLLREADDIFIRSLREFNLYKNIWQAFCVLLPIKTVGVQGDGRTYEKVLALRAVTSTDGMTADWYPFDFQFLRHVSGAITNQVKGINRVVYDVTSKPPATIEWE